MVKGIEAQSEITPEQIRDCAGEIIQEQDQPVRLSYLGQELNKRLRTSIRQALGQRPLADFILEKFGDQYEVQGFGPHKEIGRKGTWQYSQKFPHYERDFWENFERPLDSEHRRWLLPSQFKAVDIIGEPSASGVIEIERHFILDSGTDHAQKGRFVRHNISTWARAHRVDLSAFEVQPKIDVEGRKVLGANAARSAGMTALKSLIDAVPGEERSRYSISLDLLARLLDIN